MKKVTFIIIITCFTLSIKAQVNLQFGLVAYYPFNGNANDESGHGNNGSVIGADLTIDRFGIPNAAYEFSSNGEIIVADNDSLELTNDFSLVIWVKRHDDGTQQHLLQKHIRGVDDDGSWVLFLRGSSPTNVFFVATPDYSIGLFPNSNIVPEEWINITFTYKKITSEWKFYLNGNLEANGNFVFDIRNTTKDLYIGFDHFGPSYPSAYYYNGSLDDIRIYNRTLNSQEVQEIQILTSINESIENPLMIYPNPTHNVVNIKSRNGIRADIYSPNGSLLLSRSLQSNDNSINLDQISKGVYIIKVITTKVAFVRKLVKN